MKWLLVRPSSTALAFIISDEAGLVTPNEVRQRLSGVVAGLDEHGLEQTLDAS